MGYAIQQWFDQHAKHLTRQLVEKKLAYLSFSLNMVLPIQKILRCHMQDFKVLQQFVMLLSGNGVSLQLMTREA